jgi:hypothetical protein
MGPPSLTGGAAGGWLLAAGCSPGFSHRGARQNAAVCTASFFPAVRADLHTPEYYWNDYQLLTELPCFQGNAPFGLALALNKPTEKGRQAESSMLRTVQQPNLFGNKRRSSEGNMVENHRPKNIARYRRS